MSTTSLSKSSPAQDDRWLTAGRFAVVLGLFVFVAFPQVLIGWETFAFRDFGLFSYPNAAFQRECFWRGELPFWNPYNSCGVPFLAQWNTMPLYPPTLIYLLLPLRWSLSFFCLLHLWFAGLGMYFLAHRWTSNRFAASVAGLVFAFNGLSLSLLIWPSHIATLSWMPWVVLSMQCAWNQGGTRLIAAALVGALQMLAGGPETILLTWLITLALFGAEHGSSLFQKSRSTNPVGARDVAVMLLRFVIVVALVTALTAMQLFPFLDLAAHSQRETGFADTTWSLPGRGWANFLVPMVFGSTWNQDVFFQYDQYWTSSYYVGVGILWLALSALWKCRQRRVWLLVAISAFAFVFALGNQTFVYRWVRHWFSQLSLVTYPVKMVIVIVFSAPLLAAFAITTLRNEQTQSTQPTRRIDRFSLVLGGALIFLIGIILLWAWRFPRSMDDFPATLRNGISRAAFLVATICALFLLGKRRSARWTVLFSSLLLLLVWLDLWTHEPPQNPTVPTYVYLQGIAREQLALVPSPELGRSRVMISSAANAWFNRLRIKDIRQTYLAERLGCFGNCNLLDGLPKVNGFFSLYPRGFAVIDRLLYGTSTNFAYPALLDFLSVSHITAPGEYVKFEPRPTFLPVLTAGQSPVFLNDADTLTQLTRPEFQPSKVVFLQPEARGDLTATGVENARVELRRFTGTEVEAEVESKQRCLVVISQTYYHPWRAYIDERPCPFLWRANIGFQAVEVPAGRHRLQLAYEDRAFKAGALISAATFFGCAAAWAGIHLRRRRSSKSSTPSAHAAR